ncbi:16S rRNA (guanine(966)-N(2))-methyltransferase RsmD [Magnetospirillum sp. 64-120]|uniref:16S rRNA (guanine(966)-N(2))-methyltransferase RsmD n=1 Tax=Magnetospirillum sp. 64-120 TaxID=1895778 RepID=UPI0009270CB1|nr:16S rRNA (guanine(966)-N(2))-methyltransferase RsmD [Magnetospirillum sp. 64-120]OJX81753.1 MAG: 16S rRNA (guanine(966)-N(2))-methyltransferase RsmD [Magnetospirillum sp. 64-120]
MRIVGGKHKGRALKAPDGRVARPTADRARESLFNILAHSEWVDLDGAHVVDCFAGSGGLGLEALSRGAASVTFVENHPSSLAAIRANLDLLKERADIIRADATRLPPAKAQCDLALVDAPYQKDLSAPCVTALAAGNWLRDGALVVVEVAAKEDFLPPAGFEVVDSRVYGAAKLILLLYRA